MTGWMFRYRPQWKEELVVTGSDGALVLEYAMGTPSAIFLPTEDEWALRAPGWAKPHWATIKRELEEYCREDGIEFHITPTAHVSALPQGS